MRSVVAITVLIGVVCAVPQQLVTVERATTGKVIANEYIVVFQKHASNVQVERHHHKLSSIMSQYNDSQLRVMHRYHIGSFRGYSAHLNDKTLEAVRGDRLVQYIEHNQVVKAYHEAAANVCTDQTGATWGIVRTSIKALKDNKGIYKYSTQASGEGVNVYILDTGIFIHHDDFEGRALAGESFVKGGTAETDEDGHGTHVAGTVMSKTYGIAKKATAIAVKVLGGKDGSGSMSGVISGVNWVANQHKIGKKSVANMSLGGDISHSLNDAVTAAVDAGVHFTLAAGNDNQDACKESPASTPTALTVAASDKTDSLWTASNWGKCVDIVAPGFNITSTFIGSGTATATFNGTSMAAPHVAGVMAKILSDPATPEDFTPAAMRSKLLELASENIINKRGREMTNNYLLFDGCKN